MAGIKFSREEFEKHIKLTKETEEKISLMGTHLESVNEQEIELEIMPNRPDLYSLSGFVRAFKTFLGKEKGLKKYNIKKPEKNFEVKIDSSTLKVRPYTACCIVRGMIFDDEKIKEIIDIQEKIHTTLGRNRKKIAIGIYPLEKISLPITLKAENPKDIKFQPLEMDRELNGLQILQQHPTGREYAHLLEGADKFPIFIDAKKDILSMPPIINSHKTGKIDFDTNQVFIECSGFNLDILKKTINILATMFADLGGQVYQMKINHPKSSYITPDLTPENIKLHIENANKFLGLNLKAPEIKNLLEKMGYDYDSKTSMVKVPAWRTDVMHEVDLIEDIAIAYGINKFEPEIPNISFPGKENPLEIYKRKISNMLCGLQFLETSNYHLMTKEDAKTFDLKEIIELEDSKSEYKILRQNLLVYSLKILSQNIDEEYPQKIFETGRVFERDSENITETGILEKEKLSIAICDAKTNFTEIKQVIEYVARMLNKEVKFESKIHEYFIEGRCAKIMLNEKEIGFLGEIKPKLLQDLRIKMPVSALELDIEKLF